MRTFIRLTAFMAVLQFWLPFWAVPAGAGIITFIWSKTAKEALWSGGAGLALTWLVYAGFIDLRNHGLLSTAVAPIFMLPSSLLLYPVLLALSGLTGGLAGLAGFYLQKTVLSEDGWGHR